MHLFERFWTGFTCVMSWLTLSPIDGSRSEQHPLNINQGIEDLGRISNAPTAVISAIAPGPTFKPPTGRKDGLPGDNFRCEYPKMIGYEPCSSERDRGCWLRSKLDLSEFNIHTDYEKSGPTGVHRYYTLNATEFEINADGQIDPFGKVFIDASPDAENSNPQFPGPWIQACWGDTLHVTVNNNMERTSSLPGNGTSIHWHGIRQLNSMPMDGVNGITQCPIPPGGSFTYVFNLTQYGSSWYHSHYSVQYADGLQGPLTIHGPSSANYDEAKFPTIMTDWGHRSASASVYNFNNLGNPTVLLNGTGDVTHFYPQNAPTPPTPIQNTSAIPPIYQLHFEGPKQGFARRYLIRLINTSFMSTLTFSIDNHLLQVISADFVAIAPYMTHSVNVAIGQRYNIIVNASEYDNPEKNFWIRVQVAPCADGIKNGIPGLAEKLGIVRYDPSNIEPPNSMPWPDVKPTCADETPLVPIVPWCVDQPKNGDGKGEDFSIVAGKGMNKPRPYILAAFVLDREQPDPLSPYNFQVNYSIPVLLNLNQTDQLAPQNVIIPEDYTDDDWVYMVISNPPIRKGVIGLQHPIHLHGHDFAILKVANTSFSPDDLQEGCPGNKNLSCTNPTRRDVVLVPSNPNDGGHAIIAFRTDNPGSWLMHCHIAFHAAGGLALQVLERLPDAQKLWPPSSAAYQNAYDLCKLWKPWWADAEKHGAIEDDSGI